ncbi:MAG: cupin domain-containing protein [Polaromonas sp.]|uniref:cupin domain-containing protein n=1 Tax=Polaromonas sp. TaxID=1869339 RepID=UPI003263D08D
MPKPTHSLVHANPTSRAQQLIEQLKLEPHPEGGWYREVFRSACTVIPQDGRPARNALTSIYFLLEAGNHSRWHRVLSDEVWIHLEGAPLTLWTAEIPSKQLHQAWLSPVARPDAPHTGSQCGEPQQVVRAGLWQAAQPDPDDTHAFTLVACAVAPGFDFLDFQLMRPDSVEARWMAAEHPHLAPPI